VIFHESSVGPSDADDVVEEILKVLGDNEG